MVLDCLMLPSQRCTTCLQGYLDMLVSGMHSGTIVATFLSVLWNWQATEPPIEAGSLRKNSGICVVKIWISLLGSLLFIFCVWLECKLIQLRHETGVIMTLASTHQHYSSSIKLENNCFFVYLQKVVMNSGRILLFCPVRLQGDTVRVVEPLQYMLLGLRRVLRVATAPLSNSSDPRNFYLGTGEHRTF